MIVPLTKRKTDGTLYLRPDNVEPLLKTLTDLPRDALLERGKIRDRKHPDYVPSECLLYFIRNSRRDNSDAWFERLYKVLADRVLRAVPRAETSGNSLSLANESVRTTVFDRFAELLAEDRQKPGEKLDFFEVRFDLAIKRLRLDAQERVWRDENRSEPIDDPTSGNAAEAAEAISSSLLDVEIFSDPLFRERLYAAIDALPSEQSRTMHLLLLGWQAHSNDPAAMTIAKALGCSDRSVRNYRARAEKTLNALFNPGDDQ